MVFPSNNLFTPAKPEIVKGFAVILAVKPQDFAVLSQSIKPFLREEGIRAIEDQGLFITNEGEYETPLIDEKDCAYVIFDQNKIAKLRKELLSLQ